MPRHLRARPRRAHEAGPDSRFRLVALDGTGEIYLEQYGWPLRGVPTGERNKAARALAAALRSPAGGGAAGDHVVLRLYISRWAPWREARVCLRAALEPGSDVRDLDIAVTGDARHWDRFMRLRLSHREVSDLLVERDTGVDPTERARIRAERGGDRPAVQVTRSGAGSAVRTAIRYAGLTFQFPSGDGFSEAAFVREANVTWSAFQRHAAAQPREPFVTLDLDEALEVPWAYIVGVVDVLADLGVTRLNLPSAPPGAARLDSPDDENRAPSLLPAPERNGMFGMALEIPPLPEPFPTPDCGPVSRDGPGWLWLLLAGLLAAAVPLLGARRPVRRGFHIG